jgi:quinol monooxygenase YgiN
VTRVARYGKTVAKEGRGDDVAAALLAAADALKDDAGCELYLVNRQQGAPDTIWVTELWRGQSDLDAARERVRGSDDARAVLEMVDSFEVVELDLLGGKG